MPDHGPDPASRQFGRAWLALTVALALHVTDEALTGFLDFFNPLVESLRARWGSFPMPTFEFWPWLRGLTVGVTLLFALSWFAYRGAWWMRPLAYVYATIMLLNGLGHTVGSLYFGRLLPGVYSSPLLLGASLWLFAAASQSARVGQPTG